MKLRPLTSNLYDIEISFYFEVEVTYYQKYGTEKVEQFDHITDQHDDIIRMNARTDSRLCSQHDDCRCLFHVHVFHTITVPRRKKPLCSRRNRFLTI